MRSFLTRGLTLAAVGALLLGAPTPGLAGGMNKDKATTTEKSTMDKSTTGKSTTGKSTDSSTSLSTDTEKLVGKAVYGEDDKPIGEIVKVESDASGKLKSLVVDVGSYLGLGTRQISIPESELKIQGDMVTASKMTKDKVESAPAYSK